MVIEKLLGRPIEEPAYRWAAAFGVTSDGLPMIGAVPRLLCDGVWRQPHYVQPDRSGDHIFRDTRSQGFG